MVGSAYGDYLDKFQKPCNLIAMDVCIFTMLRHKEAINDIATSMYELTPCLQIPRSTPDNGTLRNDKYV